MFAFVELAHAADEGVVETTPFGEVVVVTDDRVPLAWMRMAFPIGRYDLPDIGIDPESLWRVAVLMPLADSDVPATVTPWMTGGACGIDAMFLAADREAVAGHLHRILVEDYRELGVPNLLLRAQWRDQRHLPTQALSTAVADVFYLPHDPRRTVHEPPTGGLRGYAASWLRDRVFADPHAVYGVAGAMDAEQARDLVTGFHANGDAGGQPWPTVSALRPLISAEERPADVVVEADSRGQVLVAWARPGVGVADPTAPAALMVDAVIRDQVQELVREVRGDAYAVDSSGIVDHAPGAWVLTTGTSPERVAGLVAAVEGWFDGVARDGLPPAAIETARTRFANAARASGSPFDRLAEEMDRRIHRDQPGGWDLLERARSVPTEEVDAFARAFCGPAGRTRFRVLPPDVDDPLASDLPARTSADGSR